MVELPGTVCMSASSNLFPLRQAVLLWCRRSCTSSYSVHEEGAGLWEAARGAEVVVEPEVDVTRRSRQRLVGYRLGMKKDSHASQAAELPDSGVDAQ